MTKNKISGMPQVKFNYALTLVALLWGTPCGMAQDISLPQDHNQSTPIQYMLSLDQVMKLALENNFDIQLIKYDVLISRTGEGVAKSVYDTILEGEISYRNDKSQPTSSLAGSKSIENHYDVSLSKKLPSGTTVTLESNNARTWTDSTFATLNPSHESVAQVTIDQELGRNFFGMQDRGQVRLSLLDITNSKFSSLDRIMASLVDIQIAYWDLAFQYERVHIEEQIVDQAKRLKEINQKKLAKGLTEEVDTLASEANYRQALNDLMLVKEGLQSKENVLKFLLNLPDEISQITPSDSMKLKNENFRLEESLQRAFENRYDYQSARNRIQASDITLELNKNKTWPEINLKTSLARNGVDDHFTQTFSEIAGEDNSEFFTGVTMELSLENSKAKAELKAAEWEKAKALLTLKLMERRITINIVDQVRKCHVLQEVAANQQRIADLQVQKLKKEEERFSFGRSDTDTLIRYQREATLARYAAAEAKFRYYTARVELLAKEGTLLSLYWDGEI